MGHIYDRIRPEIEKIPIIDSHSHVLHWNIAPALSEGAFEVQPLAHLALDFSNRLSFVAAGMSFEEITDILRGRISPEGQKKAVLKYAKSVRNTLPYIYMMQGIRELYDLSANDLNEENWEEINSKLVKSRQDIYGTFQAVFEKCNIRANVLNLWALKGISYFGEYRKQLSEGDREIHNRFFVNVATFDFHAFEPFSDITALYASQLGCETYSIDGYEKFLEKMAEYFIVDCKASGFKISEGYFRKLDYEIVDKETARECYKADRSREEEKLLNDYTACKIFTLAEKYDVPVQIHTGCKWGEFDLLDVNPSYLEKAIITFKYVKFDLLHAGEPYLGESAVLASYSPNVYMNLGYFPVSSYELCIEWLGRYLDKVPCNKISLGWDMFNIETVCGAAGFTRDILAIVLGRKVEARLYTYDMAMDIAKKLMHENIEVLYKL